MRSPNGRQKITSINRDKTEFRRSLEDIIKKKKKINLSNITRRIDKRNILNACVIFRAVISRARITIRDSDNVSIFCLLPCKRIEVDENWVID